MVIRLFVLALAMAMLAGCAASPVPRTQPAAAGHYDTTTRFQLLSEQARSWQGVPHRRGGTNRRGIDCSGFVYVTFKSLFEIELPRTARQQAARGRSVKRRDLVPGDLVFFKIGIGARHVGIYLDGGRFVHVSESQGVVVNSLDSPYWTKRYWTARRVM